MRKNTFYNICLLQFIGPILVILGHSLNGIDISHDNLWYIFTKQWIYIFHMPLFFMISGYLLSRLNWMRDRTYGEFISAKAIRLLVPYFSWNALFIIPKILASGVISDTAETNILQILRAFIFPRENVLGHTWYLFAAFLVYTLTPFWQVLIEKTKDLSVLLIIMGWILYVLPINTNLFCLTDLHKNIPFFLLGCLLGSIEDTELKRRLKDASWAILMCGVLASVGCLKMIDNAFTRYCTCLIILLSFFCVATLIEKRSAWVEILAKKSFGIYILHWPAMITTRVIVSRLTGGNTVITVISMILAGYIVPLLILFAAGKIKYKPLQKPIHILIGA